MYLLLICVVVLSISYKEICVTSLGTMSSSTQTIDYNRTLSESESQASDAANETVQSITPFLSMDSGAAMRTFYVVAFAMATVVIYFVIRAVRLRRRKSKSRKYGVITSTSALEMEPLEKGEDDDDEDTTLFEVHHHNKYGQK